MPGRRNSEGKGAAETGLRPRELPQAWSSATSFSHGTDGPALHPGFGSRFPGCPVQSGGGGVGGGERDVRCVCFWAVGSVWAWGQVRAITGALPPPHHLLAICPRKPFCPLHHCGPCPQREALGFLARPSCALPSPTASALQPQVLPPAAGRQGCLCPLLFVPFTGFSLTGDLGWDLGLS